MIPGTTETSEEIVRRSGSNLAFALALLPGETRADMSIFYAFCRVIDDLSDAPDIPLENRASGLHRWRALVADDRTPGEGIEEEFAALVTRRSLDRSLLLKIIDGVEMDLEPRRFATAADLRDYCFHVASAVGLVSIEIFGYRNGQTRAYAETLGYALQWTNIMRDVGEDASEGRIYLPLEDLDRFGVTESGILNGSVPRDRFAGLMECQSERAETFYGEAVSLLPAEDRETMRSPELMRRIYSGILEKMKKDNYRVFEKRYRLSKVRMLAEFLRAKYL